MHLIKKSVALLAIILVNSTVWSQISVYDWCASPSVPASSLITPPFIHPGTCFNFSDNVVYNFPGGTNKEYQAAGYIKIGPNFKMGSTTANPARFTLKMIESHDIVLIEPNDLFGIPQYEKLELGIELQEVVWTKIQNFIADNNDPNGINPFLEWEIDVQAVFTHPSTGTTRKVGGFFQEEFTRIVVPHPPNTPVYQTDYDTWGGDWDKNNENPYPFRIRFAPPLEGEWTGIVKVTTALGTYTYPSFSFNVIPSTNPGYVEVGANNRYFVKGKETFMPVGPDLCWPRTFKQLNPDDFDNLASVGTLTEEYQNEMAPLQSYLNYEDNLLEVANNGGNSFRFIMAPWATDIEFEKLGNYYERLHIAYELDRMVELCEDNDLTIYFDLMVQYNLETNPFHIGRWDWSAGDEYFETQWDNNCQCYIDYPPLTQDKPYCYHINDEFTLNKPEQFFVDAQAKQYYKQRLRYISSRWGYSTAIGMWELFSEINQVGSRSTDQNPNTNLQESIRESPYKDHDNSNNLHPNPLVHNYFSSHLVFQKKIEQWHDEMAQYLKNDLDDPHIISASYAGTLGDNDGTHDLASIDYVSENSYNHGKTPEWFHQITGPNGLLTELEVHGKPVVFSENGILGSEHVVDLGGNNFFHCDANGIEVQRSYWMNAFSGLAMGMDWDAWLLPEHWHFYGELLDFIDDEKFDQNQWIPGQHINSNDNDWDDMIRADNEADMVYLRSGDKFKAMGVISNRNYNFQSLTFSEPLCLDPAALIPNINQVPEIISVGSGSNELKVRGLKLFEPYLVEYYSLDNPTVPMPGFSHTEFGPIATLDHPALDANNPMIAFKLFAAGHKSMTIDHPTIVATIYPNPTMDIVNLKWEETGQVNIVVKDVSGKLVHQFTTTKNQHQWDSSDVESGMYVISIMQNGQRLFSERVVVQK